MNFQVKSLHQRIDMQQIQEVRDCMPTKLQAITYFCKNICRTYPLVSEMFVKTLVIEIALGN